MRQALIPSWTLGATIVFAMVLFATCIHAAPFDCSESLPLACGSGQSYPAFNILSDDSYCGNFSPTCYAGLYHFTLSTAEEVRIESSNNLAGVGLHLLASCDTEDCVSSATGQGTSSVSACLPAGTYYVVAHAGSCFVQTGTIDMVQCVPCSPVSTEFSSWSMVKAEFGSLRR